MRAWRAAIIVTAAGCSTILGINDVQHRDGGAGGGDTPIADGPSDSSTIDSPPPAPKIVFLTSMLYTPILGGPAGADAVCGMLAGSASLPGTYRAWISTGSSSVASRFSKPTVDYILVDGTPVAHGWAGLTTLPLLHQIDETEHGSAAPPSVRGSASNRCDGTSWPTTIVYTGTTPLGEAEDPGSGSNCSDWTSNVSNTGSPSAVGDSSASAITGGNWTSQCTGFVACDAFTPLYCFEQ